jgi:hypothetical protein
MLDTDGTVQEAWTVLPVCDHVSGGPPPPHPSRRPQTTAMATMRRGLADTGPV